MAKAYLHINGIDYELRDQFEDEGGPAFQKLAAEVSVAMGTKADSRFDYRVKRDGRDLDLKVDYRAVFAAGVSLQPMGRLHV